MLLLAAATTLLAAARVVASGSGEYTLENGRGVCTRNAQPTLKGDPLGARGKTCAETTWVDWSKECRGVGCRRLSVTVLDVTQDEFNKRRCFELCADNNDCGFYTLASLVDDQQSPKSAECRLYDKCPGERTYAAYSMTYGITCVAKQEPETREVDPTPAPQAPTTASSRPLLRGETCTSWEQCASTCCATGAKQGCGADNGSCCDHDGKGYAEECGEPQNLPRGEACTSWEQCASACCAAGAGQGCDADYGSCCDFDSKGNARECGAVTPSSVAVTLSSDGDACAEATSLKACKKIKTTVDGKKKRSCYWSWDQEQCFTPCLGVVDFTWEEYKDNCENQSTPQACKGSGCRWKFGTCATATPGLTTANGKLRTKCLGVKAETCCKIPGCSLRTSQRALKEKGKQYTCAGKAVFPEDWCRPGEFQGKFNCAQE